MKPDVHADGHSARDFAVTRTRGQARRTAFRRHPLMWAWRRLVPRRGLSERYEVLTDPNAILDRLAKLPISLWTYGWDHPSVRHLGPMSQDFAAAFGLGWNEHALDGVDCNGVLTVAVQALVKRVAHLEKEVASLRVSTEGTHRVPEPVHEAAADLPTAGHQHGIAPDSASP